LVISKLCDPDCPGTDFRIRVDSENNPEASFTLQNGQTQDVTLRPGIFSVIEDGQQGFNEPEFTGDCGGTIRAGQTLHCTITNFPSNL
jgi:hypothetical protein